MRDTSKGFAPATGNDMATFASSPPAALPEHFPHGVTATRLHNRYRSPFQRCQPPVQPLAMAGPAIFGDQRRGRFVVARGVGQLLTEVPAAIAVRQCHFVESEAVDVKLVQVHPGISGQELADVGLLKSEDFTAGRLCC